MTDPVAIANRYIALWNEADPARRRALLAEGWTENAAYVDPLAKGHGHEEINALIGAVQQRFPGFLFTLAGRAEGYADKLRFSWALGPASEADMIKGTDFALVEDGRLRSVTGFLDKVPARACQSPTDVAALSRRAAALRREDAVSELTAARRSSKLIPDARIVPLACLAGFFGV
jgi:SnoaL-like domain